MGVMYGCDTWSYCISLPICKLLRELKFSLHEKKSCDCMVTRLIVLIILQYGQIQTHYLALPKLI